MTKTYSFGNLGEKEDKTLTIQDLYEADEKVQNITATCDAIYDKYVKDLGLKMEPYVVPQPNYQVTTSPSWPNNHYNWNIQLTTDKYYSTYPKVSSADRKVEITMDDGSVESVTREELVKYIGERKLIESNEVVRKMYDRFQVAAKLARSDDDGDTGV